MAIVLKPNFSIKALKIGDFDNNTPIYLHELSDGRADTGGLCNLARYQEHTSAEGLAWTVDMPCFLDVNFYKLPHGSVAVKMAGSTIFLFINTRNTQMGFESYLWESSRSHTDELFCVFCENCKMMTNITLI